MRSTSIKNTPIIFFCIIFYSCDFRRDIIEERSIWVKVNIDWSDAKIAPNGATIYFFPHERDIKPIRLLTNNHIDSVKLYKGNYSVIVINESITEHDYILFRNTDKYETFEAYAKPILDDKKYSKAISEKRTFSPNILAASSLDLLQVNQNMIETQKDKTIYFKPKQLVKQFTIKANIKGINNVLLDESMISISGVSEGILVAKGITTSTNVTHISDFENRIVKYKKLNNSTLSTMVYIFNFSSETKDNIKHQVKLHFKLKDGSTPPPAIHYLTSPKTDSSIEFELDFPDIKTTDATSGLEVNVSDWGENISIDVPTIR